MADIITAYLNHGTVSVYLSFYMEGSTGFLFSELSNVVNQVPDGNASSPTVCAIDDSVELFPGVKSVDVKANGTITNRF